MTALNHYACACGMLWSRHGQAWQADECPACGQLTAPQIYDREPDYGAETKEENDEKNNLGA